MIIIFLLMFWIGYYFYLENELKKGKDISHRYKIQKETLNLMISLNIELRAWIELSDNFVDILKNKWNIYIVDKNTKKKIDEICSVCLCNMETNDTHETVCGHNFHILCLAKCIKLGIF
jgi:hypothetical protein